MKLKFIIFSLALIQFLLVPKITQADHSTFTCGYANNTCFYVNFGNTCADGEVPIAPDGTTCNDFTPAPGEIDETSEPTCNNAGPFTCTNQDAPRYLCDPSTATCDELFVEDANYWDGIESQGQCNSACAQNNPESKPRYSCIANQCVLDPNGTLDFEHGCFQCEHGLLETNVPTCVTSSGRGYPSALGCLPFDLYTFSAYAVRFSLGIGGALALILLVYAAYRYMTSSGDPDRLAEAKEILYAAITGLLVIALTAFIMRIIGVDVLGLF